MSFVFYVNTLGAVVARLCVAKGWSRFSLERRSAFVYSNHAWDEVLKYEARRLKIWSTKKSQAAEDGRVLTAPLVVYPLSVLSPLRKLGESTDRSYR